MTRAILIFACLLVSNAFALNDIDGDTPGFGDLGEGSSPTCHGSVFVPPTDANWNNMFPITVAGTPISVMPGSNDLADAQDQQQGVCMCDVLGLPLPGIIISFWEPLYIAEVVDEPGCLTTMGGVDTKLLPRRKASARKLPSSDRTNPRNHMFVHWYNYPVLAVTGIGSHLKCASTGSINIGSLTEVDPFWLNEAWTNAAYPEGLMFSSLPMILACIPDAIASNANRPIDQLTWCQGATSVYPMYGFSESYKNELDGNLEILGKFMQKKHRHAELLKTTGSKALCGGSYVPNVVRSQYRLDPIQPGRTNKTAMLGKDAQLWGYAPHIMNDVRRMDTAFLVWVARNCCETIDSAM